MKAELEQAYSVKATTIKLHYLRDLDKMEKELEGKILANKQSFLMSYQREW